MGITTELLYRFFSQHTTTEEDAQIQEWINESDEHRKELFRQRKNFDAILLQGNIEKEESISRKHVLSPFKKVILAVSSIAACILLTWGITVSQLRSSDRNVPMNVVIVPQGQRVNMVLADGTNVWLNANTRMEYPQNFRAFNERRIKIDGEAFFSVSKDKKHPFIVETKKGEIEAKGTQFYVSAYSRSDFFETALMEGAVEVRTSHEYVNLRPNQRALIENGHLVCRNIDYYDTYRWKDGLYCFRDLTLKQVLAQFEKYYDVHFVIKRKLADTKITGKFRLLDGVNYALKVLQQEVKFTYKRDESSVIVYIN
jgi:transmembrane sensor